MIRCQIAHASGCRRFYLSGVFGGKLSASVVDKDRDLRAHDFFDPFPVAVVQILAERVVAGILDFSLVIFRVVEELFAIGVDGQIPVRVVGVSLPGRKPVPIGRVRGKGWITDGCRAAS